MGAFVAGPPEAAPAEAVPTGAGPTKAVPTEAVPTEAGPTEAGPTEAVPTEGVPAGRIAFLVPVVAASPDAVPDPVLRGICDKLAGETLGVAAEAAPVGTPTGFDAPGNVAPARLVTALLPMAAWPVGAGAAAVAALPVPDSAPLPLAAGLREEASVVVDDAGRAGPVVEEVVVRVGRGTLTLATEPSRATRALTAVAAARGARAGEPGSESPSNTSGSSISPERDADSSVGTSAESGGVSGTGPLSVRSRSAP